MLALLGATTESELLFVTDEIEEYRDPVSVSVTGRELLRASRIMVFIGMGQLKWAEAENQQLSVSFGPRIVLSARIELIAGRHKSAVVMADTWFYHQSLTPKTRAELAAIKAAALQRIGQESEARAEFLTAISLSAWVSSLLPIALLPLGDRTRLLALTRQDRTWDEAFSVFSRHFRSKEDLLTRLQTVGVISVEEVSLPELSPAELQLLELLSQGLTISEISNEFQQVPGTVKNRLSVLSPQVRSRRQRRGHQASEAAGLPAARVSAGVYADHGGRFIGLGQRVQTVISCSLAERRLRVSATSSSATLPASCMIRTTLSICQRAELP